MKKLILTLGLIIIFSISNAQSFEKINGLGKSLIELQSITDQFMYYGQKDIDDQRVDYYYSQEYGLVGYSFDKKDICKKMILPVNSQRSFEISKNYGVRTYKNMLIIETKK